MTMMPTPWSRAVVIGAAERTALAELRRRASARPVDIRTVARTLALPEGRNRHQAAMEAQSTMIPRDFIVTFTIESGHPVGVCRHLTVSTAARDALPCPVAVWTIAEALGFVGGLHACHGWLETFPLRGAGLNLVQPLRIGAAGAA